MPIIANIVKRGDDTRKETQEVATERPPVASLKTIHELYNRDMDQKPKRRSTVQETNEINIKKTSRYLEDLTNKGDN